MVARILYILYDLRYITDPKSATIFCAYHSIKKAKKDATEYEGCVIVREKFQYSELGKFEMSEAKIIEVINT